MLVGLVIKEKQMMGFSKLPFGVVIYTCWYSMSSDDIHFYKT